MTRTLQKIEQQLRTFVTGYTGCALWSETAHGVPEDTEDSNFDVSFYRYGFDFDDIAPVAKRAAIRDCIEFFYAQYTLMVKVSEDFERHGHDFWLTRNHHGAGFWDRGYGRVGQKLTDAAHLQGGVDLYVGDDGKIYGF